MFFWFIGIGILIFKYVFKDNTADLRFLITGLLILDFVDIIFLISPISKDKNLGYIRLKSFNDNSDKQFLKALKKFEKSEIEWFQMYSGTL